MMRPEVMELKYMDISRGVFLKMIEVNSTE